MIRRFLLSASRFPVRTEAQTRCLSATSVETLRRDPRKFYKKVTVIGSGKNANEFEICLDKRRLKTPMGNILVFQSEALALAVAEEWNSQQKTIKREAMNLTALCNTVIDNPLKLDAQKITDSCLNFLPTDTLLYRCEEPPDFVTIQTQKWDPVMCWAEERFNVKFPVTTGLVPLTIDPAVSNSIRSYLSPLSLPALFAVQLAVDYTKSLILTLAVINKAISVVEAADLARLEQNYQVNRWGNVEWHHDIEHHDVVSHLAAAVLYFHYATEKHTFIKKK